MYNLLFIGTFLQAIVAETGHYLPPSLADIEFDSQQPPPPSAALQPSLASNLSCYVCSTIDDIACKYINETIRHSLTLVADSLDEKGDEFYEHAGSLLHQYGTFPENEESSTAVGQSGNRNFATDCRPNEHYCSVLRLGVSNQYSQEYTFFALQRNCSTYCRDGCFIIGNVQGERTKLSICTTCCTNSYCNVGSGTDRLIQSSPLAILLLLPLALKIL